MKIYTTAKISPKGQVNKTDLKKLARDTVIFFAAPTLMYLGQLQGTIAQNQFVGFNDMIPNLFF